MNDLQRQTLYVLAVAWVVLGVIWHLGKILYYLIRG